MKRFFSTPPALVCAATRGLDRVPTARPPELSRDAAAALGRFVLGADLPRSFFVRSRRDAQAASPPSSRSSDELLPARAHPVRIELPLLAVDVHDLVNCAAELQAIDGFSAAMTRRSTWRLFLGFGYFVCPASESPRACRAGLAVHDWAAPLPRAVPAPPATIPTDRRRRVLGPAPLRPATAVISNRVRVSYWTRTESIGTEAFLIGFDEALVAP